MRVLIFCLLALMATPAFASFIEVGASANYRYSGYDPDNYIQSTSYTASFSYYFWEMCAWELNYTTGTARQVTKGAGFGNPKSTVTDEIDLTSLDLVLSFAGREDPFRPYIKFGAGYLEKERYRQINNEQIERISGQAGMVPSAGFGLALTLTKGLSLKLGLDAWTSPPEKKNVVVDYAGRAGISWMF